MTQPIRPTGPGAGADLDSIGEAARGPDAQGEAVGSASSTDSAGSAGAAGAAKAGATGEAQGTHSAATAQSAAGAERVLADLRAGLIDRGQALEALVAQALAQPHVAQLSASKQAELAGVLRAALEHDPQLAKLLAG